MKKIMIALSFASLLLVACGGEKSEKKVETEVVTVDPVAKEMNETTQEIEQSTEELDEMLNDLEIEE